MWDSWNCGSHTEARGKKLADDKADKAKEVEPEKKGLFMTSWATWLMNSGIKLPWKCLL